jgi:cytochrome c
MQFLALNKFVPYAFAGTALSVWLLALSPAAAQDAAHGKELYEARCGACHSPETNRVGPRHTGIFGRKAGGVAGYSYSTALKNSKVIWNDKTLDQWLQSPAKFIPGTKMFFTVNQPQDRADIIAYLKTLKEPGAPAAPAAKAKKG